MSFLDIPIKLEYRTKNDDIVNDFYIPVLREAVSYKRAVGFFSSSILTDISDGIDGLVKNGGNVKFIASPKLSDEDIEAIKSGYSAREIIQKSVLSEFCEPSSDYEEERLNYLANLIASKKMDIKITITIDDSKVSMYHEKMGIIEDLAGNKIAFSGSNNESHNGVKLNYEAVDVFKDWTSDDSRERVSIKEKAFDSIWEDREKGLKTYYFPDVADEFVKKYKKSDVNIQTYEFVHKAKRKKSEFFKIPDNITLYEYQKKAINSWKEHNYMGVFDMATGSGKTYTASGALSNLSEYLNGQIAVIIVVPYIHLVEQWCDDIEVFNVTPIKAYGGTGWKKELTEGVKAYNYKAKDNFCVVTTYATFSSADFTRIVSKFRRDFCFVADEAHNAGSRKVRDLLPKKAKYRLGLSATVDRHNDAVGTDAIYKYFGRVCIKFTLEDAIRNNFLTEYYYYPVPVYLNRSELEEYNNISSSVRKLQLKDPEKRDDRVQEKIKLLLLKRARIVAGCKEKIPALLDRIEKYKNDSYILVYCGATKYDDDKNDDEDVRQIDAVTKALYCEKGMRVHKFTSSENRKEREEIKNRFSDRDLQAIVAIKCLDEGVNIPAIKTAFILASSTNPKEYIQRRGRVLRKFPGKDYAEIYDFITLPRRLSDVDVTPKELMLYDMSLVEREFNRMNEFASASKNPLSVDELKWEIEDAYGNIKEDTYYEE